MPLVRIFRTGQLTTNRVEAFSDGVMAVALTLLVLDVKLPDELKDDAAVWAAVIQALPGLAAWAVSFAFVLTFWVNHHYFFASLKHTDRGLLWLNGLFLLAITLIPLPTGLIGRHPGLHAPLALFCGVTCLAATCFFLMRVYASLYGDLMRGDVDSRTKWIAVVVTFGAALLYLIAVGLSFVWPPGAMAIQVAVLLWFFMRSAGVRAAAATELPSEV